MGQQPVRLKYAESDNFSPGGGLTGVNKLSSLRKFKTSRSLKMSCFTIPNPMGPGRKNL